MTDSDWESFKAWWLSKWITSPHRSSIEKFLIWRRVYRVIKKEMKDG